MRKLLTIFIFVVSHQISGQNGMDSLIFEEINKVRTNPKSYIPYIETYIETQEKMKLLIKKGKVKTTSFSGNMTNNNTVKNVKITTGIDLINKNINSANELINILSKLNLNIYI